MKNIHLLRILFLFLIATSAFAQETTKKEQVHLKDGSILIGEILEDNDYAVKILLGFGDTLTLGYKHIESIGTPRRTAKRFSFVELAPKFHKEVGLLYHLSLGMVSSNVEATYDVSFNVAKRINSKLNLGGGIAYTTFSDFVNFHYLKHNYLPIYAYGRYYLTNNNVRLFTSAKIGYGIAVESNNFVWQGRDDYNGGLFGQSSLGIHIANRKKFRMLVEFNVNYQRSTGLLNGIDWNTNLPFTSDYRANYIRPGITVGVEF